MISVSSKCFLSIRVQALSQTKRNLFIASIGNSDPRLKNARVNTSHRFMDQLINIYWKEHVYKKGCYYFSLKFTNVVLFKSDFAPKGAQGKVIYHHLLPNKKANLVVIHADIEKKCGKYEFRFPGKSGRGYEELKSIQEAFKSTYTTLAIGTNPPFFKPYKSTSLREYSLGPPKVRELKIIEENVFPGCVNWLEFLAIQEMRELKFSDELKQLEELKETKELRRLDHVEWT